jgi:predicted nucleic acid-binding protein
LILADTSIWIDHFRSGDAGLAQRLDRGRILIHPWIIGELALGLLQNRTALLTTLADLPTALTASDTEVLGLIERHTLAGIVYIDAHLLASTLLTPDAALWTRDRRLHAAAQRLGRATPSPA